MKPMETKPIEATPPIFAKISEGPMQKGEECLLLRRKELEQLSILLGRNISTGESLISAALNVTTLSVNGTAITLDPYLLNRLKSRCHPTEDWEVFLKRIVIEQLAGYCGA